MAARVSIECGTTTPFTVVLKLIKPHETQTLRTAVLDFDLLPHMNIGGQVDILRRNLTSIRDTIRRDQRGIMTDVTWARVAAVLHWFGVATKRTPAQTETFLAKLPAEKSVVDFIKEYLVHNKHVLSRRNVRLHVTRPTATRVFNRASCCKQVSPNTWRLVC